METLLYRFSFKKRPDSLKTLPIADFRIKTLKKKLQKILLQ
jgi:hypothetical protein